MKSFNFGRVSPTFIIIGTQKGGTSSLYYYLNQHPKLIAPENKELHYFDNLKIATKKSYINKFPKSYFTNKKSFEATPRYLYYPDAAKKIHDFNPNMKFIVMLRDPAKRAFSAWNMYKQLSKNESVVNNSRVLGKQNEKEQQYKFFYKNEFPTFNKCIDFELSDNFDNSIIEPSIVRRGYYKEQIETYLQFFNLDSFMFIDFDTFKNDTINCLNKISNFLSISSFNDLKISLEPQNKRDYNDVFDEELYLELKKHYQTKNKGLESLVGFELKWMR